MQCIFFLVVLILCGCNTATRPDPGNQKDSAEKLVVTDRRSENNNTALPADTAIESIRKEYQRINSLRLDSVTFKFECDAATTVTLYKENADVVKSVIDWGWVGDGATVEEHYYKNRKLVFSYIRTEGGVGDQPNIIYETRTYINNDKVVRYVKGENSEPCSKCSYSSSAKEYRLLSADNNDQMKNALCR